MSKITYVAKFVLTITMLAAQCNAMWRMLCRQRRAAILGIHINTQLMMESGNTHHIQYTSKNANQGCREQRKTKTKKSRASLYSVFYHVQNYLQLPILCAQNAAYISLRKPKIRVSERRCIKSTVDHSFLIPAFLARRTKNAGAMPVCACTKIYSRSMQK